MPGSPRLRLLLGAFGDPGHAFPTIALGRALVARGHTVVLQTWARWREPVQAEGMRFEAAPEYPVFPGAGAALGPYEAAARAALDTRPLVAELRPDAVVADILTLAPALAAEAEGRPVATLIPHIDPRGAPGFPPFAVGARLPRTAAGRRLWVGCERLVAPALERGRAELNETREVLGLPPLSDVHGGISRALSLVATFPQLEYPRPARPSAHVVGPLLWELAPDPSRLPAHVVGPLQGELPSDVEVEPPPGPGPLVLVAPSTSQDPEHRLLRATLTGLADVPVRVLAVWDGRPLSGRIDVPVNARLVEWASYARVMPRCDVVVCHGGHGTVARALASGCVVVAVPAAGDMNETAARVDWAGCGVRLPRRLCRAGPIALAVRRALDDPRRTRRARELAAWAATNDAGARAAALVEELASSRR